MRSLIRVDERPHGRVCGVAGVGDGSVEAREAGSACARGGPVEVRARLETLRPRAARLVDRVFGIGPHGTSKLRHGWFGTFLATAWLAYLVGPVIGEWGSGAYVRAIAGAACVIVFGALIVAAFVTFRQSNWPDMDEFLEPPQPQARIWAVLGAMAVLVVAMTLLLGPTALLTAIYIAVVSIFGLPVRRAGYVALGVSIGLLVVPNVVPGWELGGVPIFVAIVPIIIWIGREIGLRGRRLQLLARRQRAELALVEERNRVARDVHDILGHSLTVITVKTELAQRLIDIDLDRARTELADIERLAREALAGVRDTVGGLREVSLRGELANARSALAAADIAARLPEPDSLPDGDNELFGWVLREAVTNVVRHSAARHCTVTVTPTTIEVVDDGRGMGSGAAGTGVSGLRERVRAAGGTLTFGTPEGGGVRVVATIPYPVEKD